MNKPIEPRSPATPASNAEQVQKGGANSGNQAFYKADPSLQKPGSPQATNKDEQPQKLAQNDAKVVNQGPKQS